MAQMRLLIAYYVSDYETVYLESSMNFHGSEDTRPKDKLAVDTWAFSGSI
jgi:hypothetical protein